MIMISCFAWQQCCMWKVHITVVLVKALIADLRRSAEVAATDSQHTLHVCWAHCGHFACTLEGIVGGAINSRDKFCAAESCPQLLRACRMFGRQTLPLTDGSTVVGTDGLCAGASAGCGCRPGLN